MHKFKYKILVFLLYTFVVSHNSYSQDFSNDLQNNLDSLLVSTPQTCQEIDKLLGSFTNDSTALRYIEQKSFQKKYYSGQAYALNNLGSIYRDLSLYTKSLELYQEALKVAVEADNLEFRVYSLNMISTVYRRTDAFKSALDYSQDALELAETVANPSSGLKKSIIVSLNSIGGIYQMLEQYKLAIEKYEKAMVLEKELDDKLGLAINHLNLGECHESQGDLVQGLKNFRKALVYYEIIDSSTGKIKCNYNIAHIYVHEGKIQQAINILQSSLLKAISLNDQKIITTIYINLGWALIRAEDYDAAETNLESGLALAEKNGFNVEIADANKFLSELWIKLDDYQKGMKYFKESKKYEERITNTLNLRYVNDMILRYESQIRANQLERLAQENESVRLKLKKNKTMLIIIGISLILLIGILYILYRQSQLNAEKKLLTLEQSMLRSQMNPHFLFNSLNSIKLYIINNEKKNAVHYLNKFSKLVRKILEASSQREISLAEELETVELYMNIENIRFSNEINFKIDIKDDIDPHLIKIPSLILQPFLENALWHGLSSKDGIKNIDLEVKKGKNGFIEIVITDNGVGREAAEKIKESKLLKRKSVGIDITKERLANFSRDYENFFHVDIIDKFDDDTNPIGTQIVIYIPTI
ncbi:tetratricopeptide repeat protein [Maribacter sp. SA7]|nr:tetratricopeptide repeat protein [Maribacter zhoushanensis]